LKPGSRLRIPAAQAGHLLVRFRIVVTGFILIAFVAGFLGVGRVFDGLFASFSSVQLFPGVVGMVGTFCSDGVAALFVVSAVVTLGLIILTAVFGRFYCSSLCPLGTMQDIVSWAGHRSHRRRRGTRRFAWEPGLPFIRLAAFILVIAAFILGAGSIAGFLDPYSQSGRFLQYTILPLVDFAGHLLAPLARRFGLYWLRDFAAFSVWAFVAAALPVTAILIVAFFRGRLFCNTLCPVGSLLGFLNRFAPLRVRLDAGTCTACGACARVCKAECLDTPARTLDASRCVSCFSCLPACPTSALRYGPKPPPEPPRSESVREPTSAQAPAPSPTPASDPGRRSFLKKIGSSSVLSVMALSAPPIAGAVELLSLKPARPAPAAPPGARSLVQFQSACTACGLCVSKCPSGVLQPSIVRYGARGFLQPYLDYEVSYCQYECTLCTDLCPTGALKRIPLEEKKLVQMGTASLVKEKCIVFTHKTACGACAEHCPTGSVRMVPSATGIPEPEFDELICIGCGACHHICPALPEKSITVTGKAGQGRALAPRKDLFGLVESPSPEGDASAGNGKDGGKAAGAVDDFPF